MFLDVLDAFRCFWMILDVFGCLGFFWAFFDSGSVGILGMI